MILTPGFMDVHTHGGGGFNLHTSDPAEIDSLCALGAKHRPHILSDRGRRSARRSAR